MRKMEEQQQQQQQISNGGTSAASHSGGNGVGPGLLIVAAIILLVFVLSAAIHVLLRFFSRKSSSSVSTGADSPIFVPSMAPPSPSRARGGGIEDGEKDLIESLPLFTLASALSAAPKSSADCAVCLSKFDLHDQLRLLPSCRHAFHSTCIDTWLRSNLSCPLCRASIIQEAPPPPAPQITPSSTAAPQSRDSSGSFRLEIGSVSRRRATSDESAAGLPNSRSYSLGSSFHYVVEEELDAVINTIARTIQDQRRKDQIKDLRRLAEAAGGGSRGRLMDYMERLASSASSSFSSLRFAGCGSRRTDGDAVAAGSSAFWWDQEDRQQQHQQEDDDAGSMNSFFRWLVGA